MKYVIEIEDVPFSKVHFSDDVQNLNLYRAKGFNALVFNKEGLDKLTPLDKELEEAYQRGLNAGKVHNESKCVGCKYDDGAIEHSPCNYCCNAYSNEWIAKEESDEIKVGDEVIPIDVIRRPFVVASIENNIIYGFDFINGYSSRGCNRDATRWEKTGRHFSQVEELIKAMRGDAE